jgi:hypothetical protein
MKQTQGTWGKEQSEEACAQLFLVWYNNQNRTSYQLERPTENRFPKLKGKIEWEFVACQDEKDPDWKAIEVKGLVTPNIDAKRKFWRDILRKVTEAMKCRIKGTFVMSSPPDLSVASKEKAELINVITETIVRIAPSLKENEQVDIGLEIAKQFCYWPQSKSEPRQLFIKKTSDAEYQVCLADTSVNGNFEEAIEQVSLERIVKNANVQLGLAKCKGAKETILLLDCDPIFDRPEELRNHLATLEKDTVTNIDHIYLVPKLCSKDSYRALLKGKTIEEKIKVIELYSKKRRGG